MKQKLIKQKLKQNDIHNIKQNVGNSMYSFNIHSLKQNLLVSGVVASLAISLFSYSNDFNNNSEILQANLFKSQVGNINSGYINPTLSQREKIREEYQIYFDINNKFKKINTNNLEGCLYNLKNGSEIILALNKDSNFTNNNLLVKVIDFNKLKELIIADFTSNGINRSEVESIFNKLEIAKNSNGEEIIYLKKDHELSQKEEKIIDIIKKVFGNNFYIKK